MRRLLDRRVAIAAIDAELPGAERVAVGNRLLGHVADRCRLGRCSVGNEENDVEGTPARTSGKAGRMLLVHFGKEKESI